MATKCGKLWTIPRPTRDPLDLSSALKAFARIAKGKKWRGNRALQKKFEASIPSKTGNVGDYGSGGRTWAALLRVYGLWYNDSKVTITSAGEVLISGNNIYKQMVRLILNFQIPSAYSEHQKLDEGFRIFPFRFMLQLLIDTRIKYLDQDEIALFILKTKTHEEYEKVVSSILRYRRTKANDRKEMKDREGIIKVHMRLFRPNKRTDSPRDVTGHIQYINDFANTFMNHIRYLHEIYFEKGKGRISIKPGKKQNLVTLFSEYEQRHPFSTLYDISEKRYAEHYGLKFDAMKATKKSTPPKTREAKRFLVIKNAYNKIKKTKANLSGQKIVEKLVQNTGISEEEIEEIISENSELSLTETKNIDESFVENYLYCGSSGKDDRPFEVMTRDILTAMGLPTKKEKIKRKRAGMKPEIDGLIKNPQTSKSGILECKSGAKFSFPIGDCDKMKTTYIPNFVTFNEDGKKYSLDFFLYVIGNKVTGLDNFQDIITAKKLKGAVIYAKDLLDLFSRFKEGKITKQDVLKIFKSNKHITWKDIEDISK